MIDNTKRSAPHVIFLVNVVEPDIDTIQHVMLNILLYFLDCVDKRTTWGYRFFTSTSAASISTANQPFRPISVSALEKFKQELSQQQQPATTTTVQAGTAAVAPFEIIKRVLIQSIAEFHWTDSDLSSESPRRQQQPRKKQSMVDVKNFIYLVTPLPQTYRNWEENQYIPNHVSTTPAASTSSSLPSSGIALGLRFMYTEFRRWLWEDYIENRISLSWVDTSIKSSDDVQEAESIYNGMNAVLRPFGGSYMRSSSLTADYNSYGVSFASMFHNWNARTIRVVSGDAAIPRTDEELLLSNNNDNSADTKEVIAPMTVSCCTVQLLFTPQIAPIQVDMYPVKKSTATTTPLDMKQIDVLCAVYRSQVNIRSLDTEKTQLYVLFDKGNGNHSSNELYLFGQQLKSRNAVAVVRFGDRFGILEPRMSNAVMLRLLSMEFKMYDIEPEQQQSSTYGPAGSNVLDFLDMPATPTKKEKLSNLLNKSKQGSQQLKLAPLSTELSNTLQAMRDRRKQRKAKLVESKEKKKEPVTPLPSQEVKEEDVFQLPSTTESLLRSLQEVYYGTLYTQKWTLSNGIKLMYDCIDNLVSQSNSILPEMIAAIKSMAIISSAFDNKHRDLIPKLMDSSDLSNIPDKEERTYFIEWKSSIVRLQRRGIYELQLKARNALKTREGRLQMVVHMLLIWLERRAGKRSKTMRAPKTTEDHNPVDLDNPDVENQLNIYYTRVTIWENVYDVAQYLHELDSLDIKEHKLDPADISNAAFCTCMSQCLSRVVPDWTKRLLDQCTEGDLMYNPEASSSQTPSLVDSQASTQPLSSSQQQQQQQQHQHQHQNKPSSQKQQRKRERAPPDRIPTSGGNRPKKARTSNLKDLPFMRREVDLSVRKRPEKSAKVVAEEAAMARIQRSAVNGVPTMKRVGSFIKSAMSPRRSKPEKHEEEEDRVLKIRQPASPTTPRTRFMRDFGVSLSGLGYTPHRHGGDNTPSHRSQFSQPSLLDDFDDEDDNDLLDDYMFGGERTKMQLDDHELNDLNDYDDDDELATARTPRRVRKLMMDNTPSGRYSKFQNATPLRRPRNNVTERLLAMSSSAPADILGSGGDGLDDLYLSGDGDDGDGIGGLDLMQISSFNTNPLRLDSDEENEDDDNPYLYK